MKSISKVIKKVLPIFALGLVSTYANSASFDCSKAETPTQTKICSTPALSQLDDQMSQLYNAAKNASSDPEALKQTQINWVKEMRNCGVDEACLTNGYKQRITTLTPKQTQTPETNVATPAAPNPVDTSTKSIEAQEPPKVAESTAAVTAPVNQTESSNQKGIHIGNLIFLLIAALALVFYKMPKSILNLSDKFIKPVADAFGNYYRAVQGEVVQVGGVQQTSTTTATARRATENGPIVVNVKTEVSNKVSLIQIGSTTVHSVDIPLLALWDNLNVGERVGCIFHSTKNNNKLLYGDNASSALYYVHNFDKNSSIGDYPRSNISLGMKFLGILLCAYFIADLIQGILATEFRSENLIYFLISFLIYRFFDIGLDVSKKSWDEAMDQINSNK